MKRDYQISEKSAMPVRHVHEARWGCLALNLKKECETYGEG